MFFFFECYGAPPDLHDLTHPFPPRLSSDLPFPASQSASASRATINSATVFPIACAAMSEADACPKAQARTSRPRLATRPSLSRHTSTVRSEEHTSELQSLMRISYAVSCLKNKKNKQHHITKTINKSH